MSVAPEVPVRTPRCCVCGKAAIVFVTGDEYSRLQMDMPIQAALPDRDATFRELFVSGTHEHCWERLYGESHGYIVSLFITDPLGDEPDVSVGFANYDDAVEFVSQYEGVVMHIEEVSR